MLASIADFAPIDAVLAPAYSWNTIHALYCTILYCTVLYCTVMYCIAPAYSWNTIHALIPGGI